MLYFKFNQPDIMMFCVQDGFIHLTQEANLLLPVANHFYTSVPGDFICLGLDPSKLTSEVRALPYDYLCFGVWNSLNFFYWACTVYNVVSSCSAQ